MTGKDQDWMGFHCFIGIAQIITSTTIYVDQTIIIAYPQGESMASTGLSVAHHGSSVALGEYRSELGGGMNAAATNGAEGQTGLG